MKADDRLAAAVEIEHAAQDLRELGDRATDIDVQRVANAMARYEQLPLWTDEESERWSM